jgi:t-SNARE complex subunit (syntaxin)
MNYEEYCKANPLPADAGYITDQNGNKVFSHFALLRAGRPRKAAYRKYKAEEQARMKAEREYAAMPSI